MKYVTGTLAVVLLIIVLIFSIQNRESVDVSQRARSRFVKHGERIVGYQLSLDAGALEAEAYVLGGVIGATSRDREAVVDARVERAVTPQVEPIFQLG